MEVTRYKPLSEVQFYTENQNLVARGTNNPNSKIDDDIVSIQTGRDMGADAPTFSINLTNRKPWHKWVTSNDLVIIKMCRPPEKNARVMVGIVDDSRKRVIMSYNGSVQRVITITGRGVAKAFIQFDVGYIPEAEVVDYSVGWVQSRGVQLAGSSGDKIVEAMWDKIAKKHVNYSWGSTKKKLFDIIDKKLSFRDGVTLKDDLSLLNWQGSIWAFIKQVTDEPFNESYWEIEGETPTLILRPTPFSDGDWQKLPKHSITDGEVQADMTGRSDVETYTVFSVGMQQAFTPDDVFKTVGVRPLWYKPYADKYGLRRLQRDTLYAAIGDATDVSSLNKDSKTIADVLKDYNISLYNWYVKNNDFFNGSITVRGSNRFKVGDRLEYASTEDGSTREYYITSVGHNFVNFGTWTTTLGVIRGTDPKTRFDSPYNKYTQATGIGLGFYSPSKARDQILNGGNMSDGSNNSASPISGDYLQHADRVVQIAKSLVGKLTYVFGGTDIKEYGSGDCSAFTQYCYKYGANMDIGRTTGDQIRRGTEIGKDQAEAGDLIFFKGTYASTYVYGVSHVGIMINSTDMVDLQGSGCRIVKDVFNNSYWGMYFLMVRRVLQPGVSNGKTMFMTATAYGATKLNGGAGTGVTYEGTRPVEGETIAVDPNVIPLGSKVKIECSSYPGINGTYTAEDIGSAIQGNRIDIYFDDLPPLDPERARLRMLKFGKRDIKATIVTP